MRHEVVLHALAEEELGQLYDYIVGNSGPVIAWKYILGVRQFIEGLADFPERGTIREGSVPGLRIIGYRRSLSIAFHFHEGRVVILGFFYNGRLATSEILEERL
ncbi:type II toxin-antitoxin system RelE/ParE family toxin [Rhizobium sp. XQZ8]|uniref:type II toxin-antitoxin system RelE/ParE family toxin n=1 Tax=Rhizobium populisoli TaxID=2859785 RepID=UPI001C669510|nr:type II toxin-antitoxin system RelE/ParE family toxin [Rhizobium populisoli]MBW6421175.1 type II toxin-antitoxin system RelE/ParE family toxin [Rhizobium populisoli]